MDIRLFKQSLPGWGLLCLICLFSIQISSLVEIGGKHPVEAAVIAIMLGLFLRNSGYTPSWAEAGLKRFEQPLIVGIVLIGASLNFNLLLSQGFSILAIVLVTMIVGLFSIFALSRLFRLSRNLSILLAIGTTICGGTAIAVCSPLIGAKEEETGYAIGTVAIWGLIAIILYPEIARSLGASDTVFGVFAGTAIHSTPQVVGAGFIFSEAAGATATAVKLLRNCFLAPVALFCAFYLGAKDSEQVSVKKAFPWFLFGYFVMAGANTLGLLPSDVVTSCAEIGKFFILLGMAGIGLNTRFAAFINVGIKPIIVGFIGSVIVALTSLGLIQLWF